ncbi:MAG: efflux RND transporter periplasmic adaptor subunit, partial [Stomatobaculum sp.]|nr:efflux RND transporter periplasmic adaptor subunit [Stomatobaculum sp.]
MIKKVIAAAAVIAAVAAVVVLVLPRFRKQERFAAPVSLPVVETELPVTGDIRLTTSVIGKVEPSDVVYIYPKAAGDITSVNIKAGEVVTEGDVICTIDTRQVESSKNSLESARVNLSHAREELARQQIVYSGGGISDQAFAQYKNSVESAEIQYRQAELAYKTQLENAEIKSPITGVVELCNVETYDTVGQNTQICVISGQGNRVVSFSTTERIRNYMQEGDPLDVEKDGNTYSGVVNEISTMAEESTGLYKVKAGLTGNTSLPTGSRVKLIITSQKADHVMTIPVDAVYYENSEPYVYVYNEGTVARKDIETGIFDSTRMEVKSGLTAKDMVVKSWSSELYDGAKVRLPGESGGGRGRGGVGGAGGQGG